MLDYATSHGWSRPDGDRMSVQTHIEMTSDESQRGCSPPDQ
jgi:hypothetical protein